MHLIKLFMRSFDLILVSLVSRASLIHAQAVAALGALDFTSFDGASGILARRAKDSDRVLQAQAQFKLSGGLCLRTIGEVHGLRAKLEEFCLITTKTLDEAFGKDIRRIIGKDYPFLGFTRRPGLLGSTRRDGRLGSSERWEV
jgi:hypothetical protein